MSESDVAALGFVDIDNFKSVNDTYGHEIGDFWICEIAAALQKICDSSDIACRYGGDEYIFILQNIGNLDELTTRIEKFRKEVHDKAVEREQNVHCSIGIYQVKGTGKKLNECVKITEGLINQAKKNGKDTNVIKYIKRFKNIFQLDSVLQALVMLNSYIPSQRRLLSETIQVLLLIQSIVNIADLFGSVATLLIFLSTL